MDQVRFSVVKDAVEDAGFAEPDAVLINNGRDAEVEVVKADGDFGASKVDRGFVADVLELEGVVFFDATRFFPVEEFFVINAGLEVADAFEIHTEAVDGFHL